jgi:hypothetical protein
VFCVFEIITVCIFVILSSVHAKPPGIRTFIFNILPHFSFRFRSIRDILKPVPCQFRSINSP